jgi:hypothetical protein
MNDQDRQFFGARLLTVSGAIGEIADYLMEVQPPVEPPIEPPVDPPVEPPVEPPGPVVSPTGAWPVLLHNEARQRIFNRMRDEAAAGSGSLGARWYRIVIANATNLNDYGDTGIWPAIAYQMTGDPQWVAQSWLGPWGLQAMVNSILNDQNTAREVGAERVVAIDWIWPGCTVEQRASLLEAIIRLCTNEAAHGLRAIDSDQTTGIYMLFQFVKKAFGDPARPDRYHPLASSFADLPWVGGLDATGRDRTTSRNCILDYVTMAAGGEWVESSEYNGGTVRLLLMCAYGLGMEHFPEVAAWVPVAAKRNLLMMTDDLKKEYQWGDIQQPHTTQYWRLTTTSAMFDDPHARWLVRTLMDLSPALAEPLARALFLFDPYGPEADRSTLPTLFDARGIGVLAKHASLTDPQASMFCAHCPPTFVHPPAVAPVDHNLNHHVDFHLYRRGDWAQTHPLTYSAITNDGRGQNGMLHRGMGAPDEFRGHQVVHEGPDWLYVSAIAGGTILPTKYTNPPETFWHEWKRSLLWVRATGGNDIVVIMDRSHVDDPTLLPKFSRYASAIRSTMLSNPLREWRIHMPVIPTIAGQSATWPISNGETAKMTWLRPDVNHYVASQSDLWGPTVSGFKPTEKKYHLGLTLQNDAPGFTTMVLLLQYGDPAQFIEPTVSQIQGFLRADLGGRVTYYNTTPGPRLPDDDGIEGAYNPVIPEMLATVGIDPVPFTEP